MGRMEAPKTAISPTRQEDYARWYRHVVRAAGLADSSPVRGCDVIMPWGYAIWENIRRELDARFKATGHQNAYFPLFIPKRLLDAEGRHVEGLASRCAVVTHHRLVPRPDGSLQPDPRAALDDPLIVRPTSETIVGAAFAKWVRSHRDLPLLVNQWANVVRWELRTHLFLRSLEFLWQEGHTAHASAEEAYEETKRMIDLYASFAEGFMAMPVVRGRKTPRERFGGAVETYTIEAMMQDGKALQAGTSHYLGQGFSRASRIVFQTREGQRETAWTTSWGVSTRLVGGLVMTHSDDDGLVLPPRLAPAHVVILSIARGDEPRGRVHEYIEALARELGAQRFGDRCVEVLVDLRATRGGRKPWEWVRKGVPLRVEVGPREVAAGMVTVARRDRGPREKLLMSRAELARSISAMLADMQKNLHQRALSRRNERLRLVDAHADLAAFFAPRPPGDALRGGFLLVHWCGAAACEAAVQTAFKATIRCIPTAGLEGTPWEDRLVEEGACIMCGSASRERVIVAKGY
ncbi:Prolyl-tRNA synthetase [Minicystis rosea]|nr:Prolyl-tRNA synthetase [Minicystis rosea]